MTEPTSDVEIRRDEAPDRYSIVDTKLIEHLKLSIDTKMVLIYLFSRPPGWKMRTKDIERYAGCGRERRRRMLKEAALVGYVTFHTENNPTSGQIASFYQMHRNPVKIKKL